MNEIYTEKEILGDALNTEKNATNLYNLGANECVHDLSLIHIQMCIRDSIKIAGMVKIAPAANDSPADPIAVSYTHL